MKAARKRTAAVKARILARKFEAVFDDFAKTMVNIVADTGAFTEAMRSLRDQIAATISRMAWNAMLAEEQTKVDRLARLFPVVVQTESAP